MNITKTTDGGAVTLCPDGWLDTLSSPELTEAVNAIDEAEQITLDLERVEYLSSSGLRAIVSCHRRAKDLNAGFSVVNAGKEVMSIFALTGLDKKISVTAK